MHGDRTTGQLGLVSMTAADLFAMVRRDPQARSKVTVSFVELYNDKAYDLLAPKPTPAEVGTRGAADADASLRVREDKPLGPFVDGATVKQIATAEEFEALRTRACARMRTAPTEISKASSRSHTLVTFDWDSSHTDDQGVRYNKHRKMV